MLSANGPGKVGIRKELVREREIRKYYH